MATKPALSNCKSAVNCGSPSSNSSLVAECLGGNEQAWSTLIAKHRKLIFSITRKYRLLDDEANDVFQAVCVEVLSALPKLREAEALPRWIMQVTAHQCYHLARKLRRTEAVDPQSPVLEHSTPTNMEGVLSRMRAEEKLQEAIAEIPPRCRQLVQLLFLEDQPKSYEEVAQLLEIAPGSMVFVRQKCLDCLRQKLAEKGL